MKYLVEVNGSLIKIGEGGYNPILYIPIFKRISAFDNVDDLRTGSISSIRLSFSMIDRGSDFIIYKFDGFEL